MSVLLFSLNYRLRVSSLTITAKKQVVDLGLGLGNGTAGRTVKMAAPLLVSSGPMRYEAVLYSCGTSPVVTVHTHSDFIVLPHLDIRQPASGPHIPFSHIILTPSQPVLALS